MGQYYRVYLQEESTGNEKILNRNVDGEYTMAKLMEHSWIGNTFVDAVCALLYQTPQKIAWVGDYADESEVYEKVWESDGEDVHATNFKLDGKYIVNHTKKMYIEFDEYKIKNEDSEGWTVHPIPLLTCIGNGRGGGDYRGQSMEIVGDWYMNVISIEEMPPENYTQVTCDFKE